MKETGEDGKPRATHVLLEVPPLFGCEGVFLTCAYQRDEVGRKGVDRSEAPALDLSPGPLPEYLSFCRRRDVLHRCRRSLRVRADREKDVGVAVDREVEAPVESNAGLPDSPGLIVLLRLERGVAAILKEERKLFLEGALNSRWGTGQVAVEATSSSCAHAVRGACQHGWRRARDRALTGRAC